MLDLCLHCGGKEVDQQAIINAPTPNRTSTWVPVPHHRLLEQVKTTLDGYGMQVVNEAHALWREGSRYFGLLEVTNGRTHDDYGLSFARIVCREMMEIFPGSSA